MIIGVTGNNCSGKDTVAEILEKMNFNHYSLSNIIREELKKQNVEKSRENLISMGNKLRNKHGANVLAKMTLKKIEEGENYVFTSIRNPAEVKFLQKRKDFLLVNVKTSIKDRFKRLQARAREGDPKTLQELKEKEDLENTNNPNSQQLNKVAKMAKVIIKNDSTIEKLNQKVQKLVNDWIYKLQDNRPSWDHYFMSIAEAVRMRCNCMSSKKGAIVVKEKKIVSTGYNGSPKGVKHCNDGGCERCTLRHLGQIKSGVYSAPCICCHAEENAIVQAAANGISTRDASMYCTYTPCTNCAKLIINAGIQEGISKVEYPDDVGRRLLREAKVKLRVLK